MAARSINKKGYACVVRDDRGNIIAKEVVCLGWCKGTFFRRGKDIDNFNIRKCGKCQKRTRKQSGWGANWTESSKIFAN